MIPSRYLVVKDDIPGLDLNTMRVEGNDQPRSVPPGFNYLDALSMHGETCMSEFSSLPQKPTGEKSKVQEKATVVKPE